LSFGLLTEIATVEEFCISAEGALALFPGPIHALHGSEKAREISEGDKANRLVRVNNQLHQYSNQAFFSFASSIAS
jgi:hypothetical protein